jgi:predicted membrane-bound mannosyltransferase
MEINTKKHCILLILVISLAIFLRVWRISEIFEIHDFHEAYGIQILKTGVLNHILKYPILTFLPVPFSYFLQIPFFYFLGQTVFALKLPFAISGILTIFFLYLFTKEF